MTKDGKIQVDPAKEIKRLQTALAKERTKSTKLEELVQAMTTHDELTGLYNKSYIQNTLNSMYYDCKRYQKSFCIVLATIDRFRQTKDKFGLQECENILVKTSEFLQSGLRKTDWAGRLGNEEFIVILPFTNLEDAARMADRLRKFIVRNEWREGNRVTASLGVAKSTEAQSCDALLELVKVRQKAATKNGRNCVVYKS